VLRDAPKIAWCGDSYVSVQLFEHVDIWSVAGVLRVQQQLAESDITASIIASVPGWTTLLLWLDTERSSPSAVEAAIRRCTDREPGGILEFESRVLTLPTIYGGAAGPDLEFVAERNGISVQETVRRLEAPQFAGMVSFSPGMANCMWLDERLALSAPKYDSPRTTTPVGTVGLGGSSISLYSVATPGGFQMVGRMAVPIYQARPTLEAFAESPTLLRPGDRIVLRAIESDELAAISDELARGTYTYSVQPGLCIIDDGDLRWS
jgi:KipI family sensor histidine kinase inhibitor